MQILKQYSGCKNSEFNFDQFDTSIYLFIFCFNYKTEVL